MALQVVHLDRVALKRLVSKRFQAVPGILALIQTTCLKVARQVFTAAGGTSGKDRTMGLTQLCLVSALSIVLLVCGLN